MQINFLFNAPKNNRKVLHLVQKSSNIANLNGIGNFFVVRLQDGRNSKKEKWDSGIVSRVEVSEKLTADQL